MGEYYSNYGTWGVNDTVREVITVETVYNRNIDKYRGNDCTRRKYRTYLYYKCSIRWKYKMIEVVRHDKIKQIAFNEKTYV